MMPLEPQRSGGASDGQRLGENSKMPPPGPGRVDAELVGHLSQSGHLVMGPGARRDTASGMIVVRIYHQTLIFPKAKEVFIILII